MTHRNKHIAKTRNQKIEEKKGMQNTNGVAEHERTTVTWKALLSMFLPVILLVISGWISLQVQLTKTSTKVDSIEEMQKLQQEQNKELNIKLDKIYDAVHNVELQLKDKQDRNN